MNRHTNTKFLQVLSEGDCSLGYNLSNNAATLQFAPSLSGPAFSGDPLGQSCIDCGWHSVTTLCRQQTGADLSDRGQQSTTYRRSTKRDPDQPNRPPLQGIANSAVERKEHYDIILS